MNRKQAKEYVKEALALKLSHSGYAKELGAPEKHQSHLCMFPEKLYKYRMFDDYTIDMIEGDYLYLCPAEKLDDQFECSTNFTYDSVFKSDGVLTKAFIDELADMVSDFPKSYNKKEFKQLVRKCLDRNNNLEIKRTASVVSASDEIDDQFAVNTLETFGALFSGMWQNESNLKKFEEAILKALNAKKDIGICSLSEIKTSQVMWEMYSNHYEGYCIEYNTSNSLDLKLNTFPVIYGNKRETNILKILVGMFLESFVKMISKDKINQIDRSLDYIHLFLTKYKEWSFQREWRIIGDADFRFPAPTINAIYVGKRCSDENFDMIYKASKKYGFQIYRQKDNIENLTIEFEKVQ